MLLKVCSKKQKQIWAISDNGCCHFLEGQESRLSIKQFANCLRDFIQFVQCNKA
jgi:hypothetical protein